MWQIIQRTQFNSDSASDQIDKKKLIKKGINLPLMQCEPNETENKAKESI